MTDHVCSVVPPYILEAMAESQDPVARQVAHETLAVTRQLQDHRHEVCAASSAPGFFNQGGPSASNAQGIVPDYLFEQISKAEDVDDQVKKAAADNLALSQQVHDERQAALGIGAPTQIAATASGFWRGVYTVKNQGQTEVETFAQFLPGDAARLEGQPSTRDPAVNQAYDNCLEVLKFYKTVFNHNSVNDANLPLKSSVHCGKQLGNAFWHPTLLQMLYGDGDASLHNFTGSLDVVGHEITVSLHRTVHLAPMQFLDRQLTYATSTVSRSFSPNLNMQGRAVH